MSLTLAANDITLAASATDKSDAIKQIAASMVKAGLVEPGYGEGMLAREQQTSTFLGNGIAIPHGTTDTRGMVKQTGVRVFQFPAGIEWGNGQTAYVAIGIAAKSDEHLGILKQLTRVLGDESAAEQLKTSTDAEQVAQLLAGTAAAELVWGEETVSTGFPAANLVQVKAVAAGMLNNVGVLTSQGVAAAVSADACNLGQGLWLAATKEGVEKSGVAVASLADEQQLDGAPLKALVLVAAKDAAHLPLLTRLDEQLAKGAIADLLAQPAPMLVAVLNGEEVATGGTTKVFTVVNPHGLHARPGAMLIKTVKQYESKILVTNLDGDGKAVNAKSLMKVIGLGVKQGHRLEFTAEGPDAEAALDGIGAAIASGLGEKV